MTYHAPGDAMSAAAKPTLPWRVHHVVAELDARGEVDGHTAMCLRLAIDAAHPARTEMVRIDLRDLTAIDSAGLKLFAALNANCHAHGMDLGLLISGHERHRQIAEAFVLAGLGDTLHYTGEPQSPATARLERPSQQVAPRRTRREAIS